MVLLLGLWLLWALAASQEICRSSGELPAPSLIVDRISARQNNSITLLCFIPMHISVTRVIFCKDGKEILVLPKDRDKFIFEAAQPASPECTGEYFCRYQHKDDQNQEKNSLPSAGRYLSRADGPSMPGGDSSGGESLPAGLGLIVGLAVMAGLALGLLGCFLMKAATCQCKKQREQNAEGNTDKTTAGKLIDASSAGGFHYTELAAKEGAGEEYEKLDPSSTQDALYSALHRAQ